MTDEKKIELIADILEADENEITKDKQLQEFDTWDSVAVLSVIAVMNDEFNKFPKASEFKDMKTIGELMDFMKE